MSASLLGGVGSRTRSDFVPPFITAVLATLVVVLFATAPREEQFVWTDAASFALNGDLIRDYVAHGLPGSPIGFAREYFLRYPALTISLYPPIFPVVEAALFGVFGFSHAVAQAAVELFAALACWGAYLLARTAVPRLAACALPLMLFACPGVLLWSRQVMMEVPSLAFLLLAAALFLQDAAAPSQRRLLLAAAMLLAAIYTKQTAVFALPAFGLALLVSGGLAPLRRRANWVTLAGIVLGLLPLAVFTLLFAAQQFDVATSSGLSAQDDAPSRLSFAVWLVYARALPEIVGWWPLLGAACYVALAAVRGVRSLPERRLAVLMASWFVVDYAFVSLVGHFEARYGTALAVPPAVLTVLFVARLLPSRLGGGVILGGAAAVFAAAVFYYPVPAAPNYAEVSDAILAQSDQDDVVFYNGEDSKSLSFSLRAHGPNAKVFLVRAEKPLLNYRFAMQQERGITDANLSEAQIEALIDRLGVTLIVLQDDYWTDHASIARLRSVALSERFTEVAGVPLRGAVAVRLFRNRRPTRPAPGALQGLVAGL